MEWYEAVGSVAAVFFAFALVHSLCVTSRVKGLMRGLLGERFVKVFYRLLYSIFSAVTTLGAVWVILQIPDQSIFRAPA